MNKFASKTVMPRTNNFSKGPYFYLPYNFRVVPELEILTILPDLTTKFTKADKKCGNKIY